MPRTGPRRALVAFKLHENGIAALDQRALDEGLIRGNGEPLRSEILRRMVAYATEHMPKGWTLDDETGGVR